MSMFNRSFLSCELIGNLGQEPKSVQTKTGKPMATFTVAVTTSVKDADGNWSNQTQWVGCTTFGGFAERALKVLHKGTMVLVKGGTGSASVHEEGRYERRHARSRRQRLCCSLFAQTRSRR